LKTYVFEREKVAANLIEFDRNFAKAFSSKSVKVGENGKKFSELFVQAGRYTAGLTSKYEDSSITKAAWSKQSLATNLVVGMRFPSTQVVRHCDAKAMQLVKVLPGDGRWRIVIFAGDISQDVAAEKLKGVRPIIYTLSKSNSIIARGVPVIVHKPRLQTHPSRRRPRQLHRTNISSIRRTNKNRARSNTRIFPARNRSISNARYSQNICG
jgi:phenol 2-monooxygenase